MIFLLSRLGALLLLQIDRNGNLWVLTDRLPVFMYSHLDLQDYNFRILTGSGADLIMGTACAATSSPSFTTRMMHDHMEHMDHVDHMDHMDHTNHLMDHSSTTPNNRYNSGSKMSPESILMTMLLTRVIEALAWEGTRWRKNPGTEIKTNLEIEIIGITSNKNIKFKIKRKNTDKHGRETYSQCWCYCHW